MTTKKVPAFGAKPFTVTVGNTEFVFSPTVQDANNYANSMKKGDIVSPAFTYLTRTVAPEQKEELTELLIAVPGLTMDLYMSVSEEAKGGITITVKN